VDIAPPLSALVPQLLQILRTGHPSFVKDEPEYNFRRTILDIILRVMYADAARFPYHHFFSAALHIVRTDNEENATAVLKTLADCGRVMKSMPAESLAELSPLFSELCRNLVQFAPSLFTPDRPAPDPQAVPSGMRSVRVVTEMTNVILAYVNVNRVLPTPNLLGVLGVNFQILEFEVPIQKQTRQEHERLGGVWAGMSPQVTNEKEYEDLMVCQTRVCMSHGWTTYAGMLKKTFRCLST
jgi:transformation/transcription domain-associated protein